MFFATAKSFIFIAKLYVKYILRLENPGITEMKDSGWRGRENFTIDRNI